MYMFKQPNFTRNDPEGGIVSAVAETNLSPLHQKRAPTIAVDALSYWRL